MESVGRLLEKCEVSVGRMLGDGENQSILNREIFSDQMQNVNSGCTLETQY